MQEALYCVYLDRKNHPSADISSPLGTATSTLVAPREVFRGAILSLTTIPLADPTPSAADIQDDPLAW